ncbi:MAG: chemoreceptor glutamine deamidase CheD [Nitrococcus sp.]|nr:chemoreceptor glutamine deamidase CheD [Nitrococcus sp.]
MPGLVKDLPGFAHIARYRANGRTIAKILPGEYYVTRGQELLATVLGSCVAACVRDVTIGIGGMNHFMLPASGGSADRWGGPLGKATRYGTAAMEQLINDILKYGGRWERLEVKIFGGSKVLARMRDVGESNIRFVREYIAREGLPLVAADVGGASPRNVLYCPHTGEALVRRLGAVRHADVAAQEHSYLRDLQGVAHGR